VQTWIALALMSFAFASQPAVPSAAPPRAGTFVDLSYPAEALAARVTGTVVVRVTTDASSRVIEAEALSGPALLGSTAVANAKQWTLGTGRHARAPRTDFVAYLFEIQHGSCNDDSRSLFQVVRGNLAVITACSGGRESRGWSSSICQ